MKELYFYCNRMIAVSSFVELTTGKKEESQSRSQVAGEEVQSRLSYHLLEHSILL